MTKQYIYEVAEQSVDIRKFEIVSDRKLTYDEVQDATFLPNIEVAGSCGKDNGITATFLYTYYGENSEMDCYGDFKEQD
jgi:hypothetical protein